MGRVLHGTAGGRGGEARRGGDPDPAGRDRDLAEQPADRRPVRGQRVRDADHRPVQRGPDPAEPPRRLRLHEVDDGGLDRRQPPHAHGRRPHRRGGDQVPEGGEGRQEARRRGVLLWC